MICVIDIGNSNIVIGLMKSDQEILFTGRIRSNRDQTTEQFFVEVKALFHAYEISLEGLEGVILSSVVPYLTEVVRDAFFKLTGLMPYIVAHGTKTGIRIATDHPASVGSDLIVDAVAACEAYDGPIAIFDLGTASTCSVIGDHRTYLGTLIMPGVRISQDALMEKAAQLPFFHLEKPKHMIGKNTIESMQSGLIYGNAAMIDGLIDRINNELGRPVTVIGTGGIAALIIPSCRHKIHYDKDLLLKGLWYLYQKNCRQK